MTEAEMNESVVKADRWSKIIALFVALGIYLIGMQLRPDLQFSAIVAAFTAVGVRLYIPYHASMRVPEDERIPIHEHPTAGGYHHGAVGLALVVGSLVAFGIHLLALGSTLSLAIGAGVTALSFGLFRSVLPIT